VRTLDRVKERVGQLGIRHKDGAAGRGRG
jgi:hypothetical protein